MNRRNFMKAGVAGLGSVQLLREHSQARETVLPAGDAKLEPAARYVFSMSRN